MTPIKKIWELQHNTICKVLGMALDLDDLKKIARKFKLRAAEAHLDEEYALHSIIVSLCGVESSISKHVQRIVEERFSRYSGRLARMQPEGITEVGLSDLAESGLPLWAILWHMVTRDLCDGYQGQADLFGCMHMLEHRLLKDFWQKGGLGSQDREIELRQEILKLQRDLMEARSSKAKLEEENHNLAQRLSATQVTQAASTVRPTPDRIAGVPKSEKSADLKRLLDEALRRNRELKEERSLYKDQVEALIRDATSQEGSTSSAPDNCACPLRHCLQGKRIAMVGGIDGLETHYRSLVESSGAEFCRHDGKCCRGERKLEECVRNADLVICPVSVTSHFGAVGVKKVCRKYGVSCCFPDSAGLGSLRRVLAQHFNPDEEVSGQFL